MKKKFWVVLLTSLLFLQVAYYWNSSAAQRKEVKVPDNTSIQLISKDNKTPKEIPPITKKTKPNVIEELAFVTNPATDYYDLNPDYVGWLNISETAIDYPVARGSDNDYYLKHNFYREEDVLGSLFMDYRNVGMGMDKHTIIYGHYAKYGQMFKDLDRYLSEEFLTSHPNFVFTDAFTKRTYKIFSVHPSHADPNFLDVSFKENEFSTFVDTLKNESIFPLDVKVGSDDKIITLVTCNYAVSDGRLFIHAVEVTD